MAQTRQKSGSNKRKTTSGNKRTSSSRTTSRKSTSRKSSGRSSSTRRKTKAEMARIARNRQVAILIVALVVCILAFICNFGILGAAGDVVSTFLFGVFGFIAFIIPIPVFVLILYLTINYDDKRAYLKAIEGILWVWNFSSLAELVRIGKSITIAQTAKASYENSALNHDGGGFLGGLITCSLIPKIGLVGTWILVVALVIVLGVIFVEFNLVAFIGDVIYGMYDVSQEAKAEREAFRSEQEAKRAERERAANEAVLNARRKRMEMTVEGVAVDTVVGDPKNGLIKNDIHELNGDEVEEEPFDFDESTLEKLRVYDNSATSNQESSLQNDELRLNEDLFKQDEIEEDDIYSNEVIPEDDYFKEEPVAEVKTVKNTKDNKAEDIEVPKNSKTYENYKFPPVSLLKPGLGGKKKDGSSELYETAKKLQQTLKNFGVDASVTDFSKGPAVTRFEIQLAPGVKVSKITNLQEDIKLNLAAADIRIEAPIPGKPAVGIEVPNKEKDSVSLRELIDSPDFKNHQSKIAFASGRDISGKIVIADIAKMPHVLIAGATGSGKSVCINTIIMSILYKARPDEVKLIMIDPKVVELSVYNGIPHLLIPVVTDPKKAAGALNWAVAEMDRRYRVFSEYGVRDMKGYNDKVDSLPKDNEESKKYDKMPQIVVIVDELADLMMTAPSDVEGAICRLAQLARAAGIHLVIATQRPSVNVITGLIKANMPSRIAFSVTSGVDSRTILDMNGAEKLLGMGDMLFFPQTLPKPLRVQGAFVSDKEVSDVVEFLKKKNGDASYDTSVENSVNNIQNTAVTGAIGSSMDDDRDILFAEVGRFLIENDKGSIGVIQRKFKVGFNRAARIMDQLEEAGVVGPEEGTKPRKILMSSEEFEQYIEEYV